MSSRGTRGIRSLPFAGDIVSKPAPTVAGGARQTRRSCLQLLPLSKPSCRALIWESGGLNAGFAGIEFQRSEGSRTKVHMKTKGEGADPAVVPHGVANYLDPGPIRFLQNVGVCFS